MKRINCILSLVLCGWFCTVETIHAASKGPTKKRKVPVVRIPGVPEPMPRDPGEDQEKWFIRWISRDKVPNICMFSFRRYLERERRLAREKLLEEQRAKKPRPNAVKYYEDILVWNRRLATIVRKITKYKTEIRRFENFRMPKYDVPIQKKKAVIARLCKELPTTYQAKPSKPKKKK